MHTATTRLTIRYTRTAVHIAGFETATTGGGNDMGSHISYRADTHCPALTRGIIRMGILTESTKAPSPTQPGRVRIVRVDREFDTAQGAYDAALAYARTNGGERICSHCTKAAALAGATVKP